MQELAAAVKAVFAYDNKVLGVYARQGTEAATQVDEAVEGKDITDRAIADLQKYTDEEKELLKKRDGTERKDYHRAACLLIVGSILAAGFLILANYVASREMARRRRAETEQRELIGKLQSALAEVKTLSGLIPICGWCKSVRNDTGYLHFKPTQAGQYLLTIAHHREALAGFYGGISYKETSHNAALTWQQP